MPQSTTSMPAAVYQGRRVIRVEDRPVPVTGPGEVLIEVSHCGVCGTDLHMLYEDWASPGAIAGHEYSGVVAQVGPGVEGWGAGDRVVGGPRRGCGTCRACSQGRTNLCADRPRFGVDPFVGAFALYKLVDAECLYRIPDGLDTRTAALTEPVAVALHGIRKLQPEPWWRVLVTGGGPIGLLTVSLLAHAGVGHITVSEPVKGRRDLALKVGAAAAIEPADLQAPALPMDLVSEPYQAAVECSGHPDATEMALANLDAGGTLVMSGTGMARPRFDANRMILNELTVLGTVEYTPDDYLDSLGLLASGRLPTGVLIEPEDQPLGRLEWALDQLSRGDLPGKVLVVPRV